MAARTKSYATPKLKTKHKVRNWQARGENAMFRYRRLIGDGLRAKTPEAPATEARIAVSVLNRMFALGRPDSEAVVS